MVTDGTRPHAPAIAWADACNAGNVDATGKAGNRPVSMVLYVITASGVKEGFRRGRIQRESRWKETKAMTVHVLWVACLLVLPLMCLPG